VLAKALQPTHEHRYNDIDEMERALYECATRQGDTWYHVFLSYRVFSEARLVKKVYEQLKKKRLRGQGFMRVYLDEQCIKPGSDWRQQFIDGLTHSLVFVPFISRGTLCNMAGEPPAGKTLDEVSQNEFPPLPKRLRIDPDEKADNVVWRWHSNSRCSHCALCTT
jgi:hypothetical protein